ncbi:MAG: hypothetical protein O2944_10705 [Proteobacteria bacterium]|nr:hypothetical protein [Pseudomonadota bacterium]
MDGGRIINPFSSVEEAWFWFTRCQLARWEGARIDTGSKLDERPCGPDDIYRWACDLYRTRAIGPAHLEIMAEYGFLGRTPDMHLDAELIDGLLWAEGMHQLDKLLRTKGMIEP